MITEKLEKQRNLRPEKVEGKISVKDRCKMFQAFVENG